MDWDKLRIFHAAASAGSFTHAGQMLALSRQISALEDDILTPLFQRHARGLTLTDEGELLYCAGSDVRARLGQAEEALKNAQSAPRGSLKVTLSAGLGTYWLWPRLKEFLKEYPELQVHLVFEDHELDLARREADIAVRRRTPVQADLIQRRLFTVHYHVYAAPAYLARAGTPQTFQDLLNHTIVVYGETAPAQIREVNWLLEAIQRIEPPAIARALRVNNLTGILHATEAGIGVSALPDYIASQRTGLVRILPEIEAPSFDAHLVYCDALGQSKRVAASRDFVVRAARDWRF